MENRSTNRLNCENVEITLEASGGVHHIIVALAYDENEVLHEINFVGGWKTGQGIGLLLHDLGIKLSRAIQGRDPNIYTASDNKSSTL